MSEGLNRTTENVVLCGANSYEQKYYFNPDFAQLPESIRNELQMMCVTFAEEAGGIFTVEFDEKGNIKFTVRVDDGDYLFDDIECGLHISKFQREKEELMEQLELYYRVVFLKQDIDEVTV